MASAPLSEHYAQNDNDHSGLDNHFDRLSITSEDSSSKGLDQEISSHDENCLRKWGLRLKDLYRLAIRFYREKEGKAVQFSYEDRLKLVALAKQVSIGRFTAQSSPPLGVLDVIGRHRRLAWQALGDMSREEAMTELVELLDSKCHLFRPHVEAHKADMENRKRIREEEEERGRRAAEEAERGRGGEGEGGGEEEARRRVREALNAQTLAQFTHYAREQAPNDPLKQEELVRRLQEEHYVRYMEEVTRTPYDPPPDSDPDDPAGGSGCVMPVASMWTRKDVKEFKESIRREGGDAVIRVGHGETVTVRVPTNDEGTCLFWEFATDHYDIGFGVYFEWSKSPTSQVSVHVSESEDDDDYLNEDDDDDEEYGSVGGGGGGGGGLTGGRDVEAGGGLAPRSALSVIVPVYRRDCQDEVFAGSHAYPGQGVYLLKFDNSYSLWRSKTLYYRVYYTR